MANAVHGPDGGHAIVLQHGSTSSKEAWDRYVDAFATERYQCICIDSLGHGESDDDKARTIYSNESEPEKWRPSSFPR